jgi:hypothetical protein
MASAEKTIRTYRELARGYDTQGQAQVRDRFLVLAADAALAGDRCDEAEQIRQELLRLNPHHLLKPFTTLAQALQSVDVKNYIDGLRRTYPLESAEQMLEQMRHEGEAPLTLAPLPDSDHGVPSSQPEPTLVWPAEAQVAERPRETPAARSTQTTPPPEPPKAKPTSALIEPIPFAPEPKKPVYPVGKRAPGTAPPRSKGTKAAPFGAFSEPDSEAKPVEGNWLATVLFFLVLAVAMALAVYTLIRPFL